jgi:hypothetical protein
MNDLEEKGNLEISEDKIFSRSSDASKEEIPDISISSKIATDERFAAFMENRNKIIQETDDDVNPWFDKYYTEDFTYIDCLFMEIVVPLVYMNSPETYLDIVYKRFKQKYNIKADISELKNILIIVNERYFKDKFFNFKTFILCGFVREIWKDSEYYTYLFLRDTLKQLDNEEKQEQPILKTNLTFISKETKIENNEFVKDFNNRLDVKNTLMLKLAQKENRFERKLRTVLNISQNSNDFYMDALGTFMSRFDIKRLAAIAFNELNAYIDQRQGDLECSLKDLQKLTFCPELGSYLKATNKARIPYTNVHLFEIPDYIKELNSIYNNYEAIGMMLLRQISATIMSLFSSTFDFLFKFIDEERLNKFMVPCNLSSNKNKNNYIDPTTPSEMLFTQNDIDTIEKLLNDYELNISVEEFMSIIKNFLLNFNIQEFKSILKDKYDSSIFFVIKNILLLVIGDDLIKDERYKDLLFIIQTVIDADAFNNTNQVLTNCVHYDPYSELADRLAKMNFSQTDIDKIIELKKNSSTEKIKALCKIIKNKHDFGKVNIQLGEKFDDTNNELVDNIFNALSTQKYQPVSEFIKRIFYPIDGDANIAALTFDLMFERGPRPSMTSAFSDKERLEIIGAVNKFPTNLISNNIDNLQYSFTDNSMTLLYKGYNYVFTDKFGDNITNIVANSNLSNSYKETFLNNIHLQFYIIDKTYYSIREFFYEDKFKNIPFELTKKFELLDNLDQILGLSIIKSKVKAEIK